MNWIRIPIIITIALLLLVPSPVLADTSAEVTVTATGYVDNPGWLLGWDKRVELTIDNTDIDAALSGFPILVYLSTSSGRNNDDVSFIFDELENDANRKKIAVTTSNNTTQCYVEIEKWDDANEKAWLWVKVPNVASGVDTVFYLYYDKDHADNDAYVGDTNSTPAENVWDEHFKAVYHMKDGVDNAHIYDSTGNNNDGTKTAANEPNEVAGQIDRAQDFDGGNDKIDCGSDDSFIPSQFTLKMRFNARTIPIGTFSAIAGNYVAYAEDQRGFLAMVRYDKLYARVGTLLEYREITTPIAESTWYSGTMTYDGAVLRLYLGSEYKTQVTYGLEYHGNSFTIGKLTYQAAWLFDGLIDEIRISDTARTAAWIKASNESEIDDLLAFGSEEHVPGSPPTDFVLTAVNDNQVDITWTKDWSTENTEIRRAIGDYPATRSDGTQVYYGVAESYSDTANDVGLELDKSTYYYRAWSETNLGDWSEDYAEGKIGGESMLLLFLGVLGVSFLGLAFTFRQMVLAFVAGFVFLGVSVIGWTSRIETYDIYGIIAIIGIVLVLVAFICGFLVQHKAAEESFRSQQRYEKDFPLERELTEEEAYSKLLDEEIGESVEARSIRQAKALRQRYKEMMNR